MLGGEGVHDDVDTVEQEADPLLFRPLAAAAACWLAMATPVWSSPKATSSGSTSGRQAMLLTDEFGVEEDMGTCAKQKKNLFTICL